MIKEMPFCPIMKDNFEIDLEKAELSNELVNFKLDSSLSKDLVQMIDGKKTITELCNLVLKKDNKLRPSQVFYKVNSILILFDRANIIEWKSNNPFEINKDRKTFESDGHELIYRASEADFKLLNTYFEKSNVSKNDYSETKLDSTFINIYGTSRAYAAWYDELILRNSLFNFSEDFYVYEDDGVIKGILGVSGYNNYLSINVVSLINETGWDAVFNSLVKVVLERNKHIKFEMLSSTELDGIICEKLNSLGFCVEATLKSEWIYEVNPRDIIVLSK